MSTNSIHPTGAPPSVRLSGPQESRIQITLKLKNVIFDVSL